MKSTEKLIHNAARHYNAANYNVFIVLKVLHSEQAAKNIKQARARKNFQKVWDSTPEYSKTIILNGEKKNEKNIKRQV